MNQSQPGAESQNDGHRERRRPMPFREHHREQNAQKRKHRTDGQIDAAGDHDDSDADAEDAVGSNQPAGVLNIRRR